MKPHALLSTEQSMYEFEQPTSFVCEIKYGKIRNFYVSEIALVDANVSL